LDGNQLENKKLDELRDIAKELGIKSVTKYKKKELIEEILAYNGLNKAILSEENNQYDDLNQAALPEENKTGDGLNQDALLEDKKCDDLDQIALPEENKKLKPAGRNFLRKSTRRLTTARKLIRSKASWRLRKEDLDSSGLKIFSPAKKTFMSPLLRFDDST